MGTSRDVFVLVVAAVKRSEEDVCIRNCCPPEHPSLGNPRSCELEDCGENSMRPSRQRIDQVVQVLRTQDRRLAEAVLLH